ncbi:MAG: N-acetyltransferase [Clostridia bacterium]|nr:N-acetyltransferase [Clostridia bacterium]
MTRTILSMTPRHRQAALDMVEQVFTEHENAAEGALVRHLVEEIRSKKYHLPELELIMVDEADEVIGYAMFSRFHLEGRYEDELLLLSPVAVKTELQRQHISRDLLEYGLQKAADLGYKAVIVEGNPLNYRSRGFVTAAHHRIIPGPNLHLPHIDCLMVRELQEGTLEDIYGMVDYSFYNTLCE